MHNFKYVTKRERAPVKQELIKIIQETQNLLRDYFTFRFDFVGSDAHNLVTCDPKTNIGYDFDVDLEVNDEDCNYTPKDIREKIMWALYQVIRKYGAIHIENSTRVIKIKVIDRKNSRILHSCDFAIVNRYIDQQGRERQEYIRFNKMQRSYAWVEQSAGYYMLPQKVQWIKETGYYGELRELYLDKKNRNNDPNKHSYSLYAETVHEICQRYGFYR